MILLTRPEGGLIGLIILVISNIPLLDSAIALAHEAQKCFLGYISFIATRMRLRK